MCSRLTFLLICVVTTLGSALAQDAQIIWRSLFVRTWNSDEITCAVTLPVDSDSPNLYSTCFPADRVPEGMVPPPLRLSTGILVRSLKEDNADDPEWLKEYSKVIKLSQRFILQDVELVIFAADCDRFDAILYDTTPESRRSISLPQELDVSEFTEMLPSGTPVGWLIGSLSPSPDYYVVPPPAPHSVTLHED